MAKDSVYDKNIADYAVGFIECLSHTKGTWAGEPFELIDWQERIIRDGRRSRLGRFIDKYRLRRRVSWNSTKDITVM